MITSLWLAVSLTKQTIIRDLINEDTFPAQIRPHKGCLVTTLTPERNSLPGIKQSVGASGKSDEALLLPNGLPTICRHPRPCRMLLVSLSDDWRFQLFISPAKVL